MMDSKNFKSLFTGNDIDSVVEFLSDPQTLKLDFSRGLAYAVEVGDEKVVDAIIKTSKSLNVSFPSNEITYIVESAAFGGNFNIIRKIMKEYDVSKLGAYVINAAIDANNLKELEYFLPLTDVNNNNMVYPVVKSLLTNNFKSIKILDKYISGNIIKRALNMLIVSHVKINTKDDMLVFLLENLDNEWLANINKSMDMPFDDVDFSHIPKENIDVAKKIRSLCEKNIIKSNIDVKNRETKHYKI